MADINITFCRTLLRQVLPEVRASGKRINKDAWVWNAGRDHWEFHGPDKFYWHGRAANAYEARYKGWRAWLDKCAAARSHVRFLLDAPGGYLTPRFNKKPVWNGKVGHLLDNGRVRIAGLRETVEVPLSWRRPIDQQEAA